MIVLALLSVLLSYILWKRREIYKLSWQLSGPIAFPILGNAFQLPSPRNVMQFLDQLSHKYGSPARLWLGPNLIIVITDAENAEILLKSKDCLNKAHRFYKAIRDALNLDGLITLKAEEWKIHRRLVSPTINLASVSAHLSIFNKNFRDMLAKLPTDGQSFDILPSITFCKITMFLETALGCDLDVKDKERYLELYAELLEHVGRRLLQPLYQIDFIWKRTKRAKRICEINMFIRELITKVIQKRLETDCDGQSFLERLLRISLENPKFTLEDVFAETITILTGASDTSSTASAFVALMLAMHPEYQEKVFQEILTVMPEKDTDLKQADLDKLEFTDLCIRETLRLYPTAPVIARTSMKPIALANGIIIPPNTPMVLGLRQIQTQKMYYGSTANDYNPYRYWDENVKRLPIGAYIPFSYGARNCVGLSYAKVSLKCFIVQLIRNYRIKTDYKSIDELKLVMETLLHLGNKHMISLERREQ